MAAVKFELIFQSQNVGGDLVGWSEVYWPPDLDTEANAKAALFALAVKRLLVLPNTANMLAVRYGFLAAPPAGPGFGPVVAAGMSQPYRAGQPGSFDPTGKGQFVPTSAVAGNVDQLRTAYKLTFKSTPSGSKKVIMLRGLPDCFTNPTPGGTEITDKANWVNALATYVQFLTTAPVYRVLRKLKAGQGGTVRSPISGIALAGVAGLPPQYTATLTYGAGLPAGYAVGSILSLSGVREFRGLSGQYTISAVAGNTVTIQTRKAIPGAIYRGRGYSYLLGYAFEGLTPVDLAASFVTGRKTGRPFAPSAGRSSKGR